MDFLTQSFTISTPNASKSSHRSLLRASAVASGSGSAGLAGFKAANQDPKRKSSLSSLTSLDSNLTLEEGEEEDDDDSESISESISSSIKVNEDLVKSNNSKFAAIRAYTPSISSSLRVDKIPLPSKTRGDFRCISRIMVSVVALDQGGFKVEEMIKKGKSKLKYVGEELVEQWSFYGNLFITKENEIVFITESTEPPTSSFKIATSQIHLSSHRNLFSMFSSRAPPATTTPVTSPKKETKDPILNTSSIFSIESVDSPTSSHATRFTESQRMKRTSSSSSRFINFWNAIKPETKNSLAMSRSSTLTSAKDSLSSSTNGSPLERTVSTETQKGHKRQKSIEKVKSIEKEEKVRPSCLPIYRGRRISALHIPSLKNIRTIKSFPSTLNPSPIDARVELLVTGDSEVSTANLSRSVLVSFDFLDIFLVEEAQTFLKKVKAAKGLTI